MFKKLYGLKLMWPNSPIMTIGFINYENMLLILNLTFFGEKVQFWNKRCKFTCLNRGMERRLVPRPLGDLRQLVFDAGLAQHTVELRQMASGDARVQMLTPTH